MANRPEPVWVLSLILLVSPCAAFAESPTAKSDIFEDRAEEMGVDFVHFAGVSGEFYIVEISGPGCGMLDYDNDGDLDLYLIQGEMLGPGKTVADADQPPQKGYPLRDRLYRNDLVIAKDGTRTLSFTDVTEASGIRADGYGVGITTADYNNDGWVDIFLTNFGRNQLWRNKGDGTFEEVIGAAGMDSSSEQAARSHYRKALDLNLDPSDEAQVHHHLGIIEARGQPRATSRARAAALLSRSQPAATR